MQTEIIEAIVLAFTIGGIVGAAAALSLKSSRYWKIENSTDLTQKPLPVRQETRQRKR